MTNSPLFTKLFGHSPFLPLQEHMRLCGDTAGQLAPFFEKVFDTDWSAAQDLRDIVVSMERQADELKRQIRLGLPQSLFIPVPRIHLLEILQLQDRIPNKVKDITGLVVARQLSIPHGLVETWRSFVSSSVETSSFATSVLNELDDLIQTGFSGSEVGVIEEKLQVLSASEHHTDELKRDVQHALLQLEQGQNPIDVIFLYQVIDWIGQISDDSQAVGNRMLYLIAR